MIERTMLLMTAALLAPLAAKAQCGPPSERAPQVRESLLVQPAWLATRLTDSRVVVLHVGDAASFAAGHVPGARQVDAHAFSAGEHDLPAPSVLDTMVERLGVSNTSRVIIYGDAWMTGWMYAVFDYLGHGDRTAVLDGGLDAWRAAGHPVSTQSVAARRGSFTPQPRTDMIVNADWLRARLDDQAVAIIDTRTPEEYAGTAREMLPRRGHLPGARLLEWERTFSRPSTSMHGGGNAPLIAAQDLRVLLEGAGATPGRTPVFYCTVGMRASHMYFVARYLGYDAKLYDGSMAEWSRRPELPLTTGTARGTIR